MESHYLSRYPRQGRRAVLCEGDIAGYEVDLIEKWLSLRNLHVDVWPCGTKTAIYGMCDAIGRAIPVLVIEDRDFRSIDQAASECKAKKKDRERRAVKMINWSTWERNEIENYLLEPTIAFRVLGEAFDVDDATIGDRLDKLLANVYVDQAAQWALMVFWSSMPDRNRFVGGLPRRTGRPVWKHKARRIEGPGKDDVKDLLCEKFTELRDRFEAKCRQVDVDRAVGAFEGKCDEWNTQNRDSLIWRTDWAGKEILSLLCRWLSGEFGWPQSADGKRTPIDWEALQGKRRDGEMDREIAVTLQPRFVATFLEELENGDDE
jgi:hypothetical protein